MTDEILTIEPHVKLVKIEIWSPKYSTDECLILKAKMGVYSKIDPKGQYCIWFSKAKSLEGKEFYIRGENIVNNPSGTNGTKAVWRVPMNKLKLMKRARVWY